MFKSYPDITILAGLELDVFAKIEKNNGKSLLIQNKTASVPVVVRGRSSTDNSGVSIVNYNSVTVLNSMVSGLYIKNTGYTPALISITEIDTDSISGSEDITEQLNKLDVRITEMNDTFAIYDNNLSTVNTRLTNLDNESIQTSYNINTLTITTDELKTNSDLHAEQIAGCEHDIGNLIQRVDNLEPSDSTDITPRIESLETFQEDATQTILSMNDRLLGVEAEVDVLKTTTGDLKTTIDLHSTDISKNSTDIDNQNSIIANNSHIVDEAHRIAMDTQNELYTTQQDVTQLRTDVNQNTSSIANLLKVVRYDNYSTLETSTLSSSFSVLKVTGMKRTGSDDAGILYTATGFNIPANTSWIVSVKAKSVINSDSSMIEYTLTSTGSAILGITSTPLVKGTFTTTFTELLASETTNRMINVAARSTDGTNAVGGYTIIFQRVA